MDYLVSEILELIKAALNGLQSSSVSSRLEKFLCFVQSAVPGTAILIASGALVAAGILDPLSPALAGIPRCRSRRRDLFLVGPEIWIECLVISVSSGTA